MLYVLLCVTHCDVLYVLLCVTCFHVLYVLLCVTHCDVLYVLPCVTRCDHLRLVRSAETIQISQNVLSRQGTWYTRPITGEESEVGAGY